MSICLKRCKIMKKNCIKQKKFIFCVNSACKQYVKRTFFLNYTNKPD